MVDKNIPSRPLVCAVLGRGLSSACTLFHLGADAAFEAQVSVSLLLLHAVAFKLGAAAFRSRLGFIHSIKTSLWACFMKRFLVFLGYRIHPVRCRFGAPTALVSFLSSRSDGGVYRHSYDEGFSHGFVLVRTHPHSHARALATWEVECLRVISSPDPFPVQALRADHPQAAVLPEKVQNQAALHMERALVR